MKKLNEEELSKVKGGFTTLASLYTNNFLCFLNNTEGERITKHHTFFKWLVGKIH